MLVHKGGKIKNWGGECRDVCHTYKIAVSKYQGRCEQRSVVFVKIPQKKIFFFFFFLGGGGVRSGGVRGGGPQGECEQIEVFVKIQKKKKIFFSLGGGGGGGRAGGGGLG